MDQDTETGRWRCPVLTKPFANHTKVVAVLDRTTNEGHVYSYEAFYELNVKTKNWHDLTTGRRFHPQRDVLLLNDPNNDDLQSKRDQQSFWHIQHMRSSGGTSASAASTNIQKSVTATRIMEQLQKQQKQQQQQQQEEQEKAKKQKASDDESMPSSKNKGRGYKVLAKDVTGVQHTTGKASSSFTSTSLDVSYQNEDREATEEEILQSYFRIVRSTKRGEKGYVRMTVQVGEAREGGGVVDVLLELHCDVVPRTCMNFLGLCRRRAYDGTTFHRLIPQFMIQGGSNKYKTTGKDKAGTDANIWGVTPGFKDEFDHRLKHTEVGTLSMANSGPNTNLQQFFITFKSCPHLDNKHTVFGLVVDGMDRFLDKLQSVETDQRDRPTVPITIVATDVLTDPIQDVIDVEDRRLEELAAGRTTKKDSSTEGSTTTSHQKRKTPSGSGDGGGGGGSEGGIQIGKYLSKDVVAKMASSNGMDALNETGPASSLGSFKIPPPTTGPSNQPTLTKKTKFGDFSSW
jgi:peptidyl-prolyl cis-trans isomerase-like protein 2